MTINTNAEWFVMVRFGEWEVVAACDDRDEAEMVLEYRQGRSSWQYKIVSREEMEGGACKT